jgi:hypothetical protein
VYFFILFFFFFIPSIRIPIVYFFGFFNDSRTPHTARSNNYWNTDAADISGRKLRKSPSVEAARAGYMDRRWWWWWWWSSSFNNIVHVYHTFRSEKQLFDWFSNSMFIVCSFHYTNKHSPRVFDALVPTYSERITVSMAEKIEIIPIILSCKNNINITRAQALLNTVEGFPLYCRFNFWN